MPRPIGRTRWAIPEGYIPAWSHGPEPEMTSHEAACLLNVSDEPAHAAITIFFEDREPAGPYRLEVPPRRTRLDSRQKRNALLSTIAFAGNE